MSDYELMLQNKIRSRLLYAIDRISNPYVKRKLIINTQNDINLVSLQDLIDMSTPINDSELGRIIILMAKELDISVGDAFISDVSHMLGRLVPQKYIDKMIYFALSSGDETLKNNMLATFFYPMEMDDFAVSVVDLLDIDTVNFYGDCDWMSSLCLTLKGFYEDYDRVNHRLDTFIYVLDDRAKILKNKSHINTEKDEESD